MKHILLLIGILVLLKPQEEVFKVCFINDEGSILYAINNNPVKVTDLVRLSDRLIFKNKSAKIVIVNSRRGCLDINWRGVPNKDYRIAELRELILPPKKLISFDSRGIGEGVDPANYFDAVETEKKVLLIENSPLQIAAKYAMDSNNFFFIQYLDDNKFVDKIIPSIGHELVFDKTCFAMLNGKVIDRDYTICYQSTKNGTTNSEVIAHFIPVLSPLNVIKQEMEIIDYYITKEQRNKRNDIILNHFYENYGKVGLEALPREH